MGAAVAGRDGVAVEGRMFMLLVLDSHDTPTMTSIQCGRASLPGKPE